MSKTKIAFICSWGSTPKQLLQRFRKQTPGNSGMWNDLIGTDNLSEADFFVVQEGMCPHLVNKVDPHRVIFIKREAFVGRASTAHLNLDDVAITFNWPPYAKDYLAAGWWVNESYDDLLSMPYPQKKRKISTVITNERAWRSNFIELFAKLYPDTIDVFGRWSYPGDKSFKKSSSYKGELNYDGDCKFRGIYPYEYSIALENTSIKNYWTEKLVDAYLGWAVPVYWGCTNVDDYFPKESFYQIETLSSSSCAHVYELIQQPPSHEMIQALQYSREKILKTYNLWAVIDRLVDKL